MRASTSKDGDLLSHSDEFDESRADIEITSRKHHLINNHDIAANKSKLEEQLPLEHIFGFCRTFEKITKQVGNHL